MSAPARRVVAVLNHHSSQSGLARHLVAAFAAAGWELGLRTHAELASEVDIDQDVDRAPQVDPDRPLLWLAPGDPGAMSPDADTRFLAAEATAAARSIAHLTRSPVLNRPSAVSGGGRLPSSATVAVRRAGRPARPDVLIRAEHFGSQPPAGTGLEVHDVGRGTTSWDAADGAVGPFRWRAAVPGSRSVCVRIVGDRAVGNGHRPPEDLVDASRHVARVHGLDVATVWWRVRDGAPGGTLARVDGWLWDVAVRGSEDVIAAASLHWATAQFAVGAQR